MSALIVMSACFSTACSSTPSVVADFCHFAIMSRRFTKKSLVSSPGRLVKTRCCQGSARRNRNCRTKGPDASTHTRARTPTTTASGQLLPRCPPMAHSYPRWCWPGSSASRRHQRPLEPECLVLHSARIEAADPRVGQCVAGEPHRRCGDISLIDRTLIST